MQHVHSEGGKFKLTTFTVKILCHKDMDVTEEMNSASINLAGDNLKFELKDIKCAHNERDLMALITYNTMGEEYT